MKLSEQDARLIARSAPLGDDGGGRIDGASPA